MKTLYVSDLDGTLLNSQQQTSTYTNQTIEKLVDQGMLFSYATARSYYSAKPSTKGLSAKIPLILYNGAFIIDNQSLPPEPERHGTCAPHGPAESRRGCQH